MAAPSWATIERVLVAHSATFELVEQLLGSAFSQEDVALLEAAFEPTDVPPTSAEAKGLPVTVALVGYLVAARELGSAVSAMAARLLVAKQREAELTRELKELRAREQHGDATRG